MTAETQMNPVERWLQENTRDVLGVVVAVKRDVLPQTTRPHRPHPHGGEAMTTMTAEQEELVGARYALRVMREDRLT